MNFYRITLIRGDIHRLQSSEETPIFPYIELELYQIDTHGNGEQHAKKSLHVGVMARMILIHSHDRSTTFASPRQPVSSNSPSIASTVPSVSPSTSKVTCSYLASSPISTSHVPSPRPT